ncbi:MAG: quinohemoprotein amine dehydrogenase subunit alpha, partial [Alphaproteobacteria bacterium]
GKLKRIHDVRKTPEAWSMTLMRMTIVHGVKLSGTDRRALVTHLSNTQGLAPSEGSKYRYILEKTPGVTDTGPSELLTQMCARCHSFARVGLQRRDKAEWLKLVNFHLGQFPTAEYQALGRDRDWWGIASTKVVEALAKAQPYNSKAWTAWKDRKSPKLAGVWRVSGHQPGRGDYEGTITITAKGSGRYAIVTRLDFAKGGIVRRGSAVVYNGHEWRASTKGKGGRARQVMSVSEDGMSMSGRWYSRKSDVVGGTLRAVRIAGAKSQVLSVSPSHIKRGTSARITISGIRLALDFDLGEGLIGRVVEKRANRIILLVKASAAAKPGARNVKVGKAMLAGALTVYDKVASVKIEPAQTFARVGGNRGPIAPVPAQFEAVGYMAGADGKAGTKDDVRIGVMKAKWSVANFDAGAKAMKDKKFTGRLTQSGLFQPAGAGPNPARRMGTNNVGNLKIIGTVAGVKGEAQLYVTVQRFVDPPIR